MRTRMIFTGEEYAARLHGLRVQRFAVLLDRSTLWRTDACLEELRGKIRDAASAPVQKARSLGPIPLQPAIGSGGTRSHHMQPTKNMPLGRCAVLWGCGYFLPNKKRKGKYKRAALFRIRVGAHTPRMPPVRRNHDSFRLNRGLALGKARCLRVCLRRAAFHNHRSGPRSVLRY